MKGFSARELLRHFPNSTRSILRANGCNVDPETVRPGKPAELERIAGKVPLGKTQDQEEGSGRVLIRFESVRKRLLDPDNLSEKWLLDCLRYCRAIRGDEPDKIELQTTQRKCQKGEEPHTEISVFKIL